MPDLGLLENQPSQTLPRFDETAPPEATLGGQAPPAAGAPPAPVPVDTSAKDPSLPDLQITPEMMEQYQQFVANGMKLIHSPQTRDRIVQHLKTVQPPERALGDATLMILKRIESQAQQDGTKVDDLIKLDGSNEIMGQLAEIAEASRAFEPTDDVKQKAYSYAVQQYIREKISTGELSPAEVKQGLAMLQDRQAKVDPEGAAMTGKLMTEAPDQMPGQPAPQMPGQPAPQMPGQPATMSPAPGQPPVGLLGGA